MEKKTNKMAKSAVAGRLWIDANNKNVIRGYLEMGLLGRLKMKIVKNLEKNSPRDCDWVVMVPVNMTFFGMMEYISRNLTRTLDELWESDEENGVTKLKEE